jgi:hypothetical protein
MGYFSGCVAAALTTVLVSGYVGGPVGAKSSRIANVEQVTTGVANSVARERKSSLLLARRLPDEQAQPITEIDVVGLNGAVITFRDAQGRILLRTDRVTNTTTVAKGVVLPEVTVREMQAGQVKRLPVEVPKPASFENKLPGHCESAFSPVASPGLSQIPGRCVAALQRTERLAVLR